MEPQEADTQADYDKITQENKVTKTLHSGSPEAKLRRPCRSTPRKDQDVRYKTTESVALDKAIEELPKCTCPSAPRAGSCCLLHTSVYSDYFDCMIFAES